MAKGVRIGAKGARKWLKWFGIAKLGRRSRRGAGPTRAAAILTAVGGAAAEYFLDPRDGRRRRNLARDRIAAFFRGRFRDASRAARYAGGAVQGAAARATPGGGREDAEERLNDPALARKVESEIFRDADAPKDAVSVNAEHGVIYLRGEVADPDQIRALVEKAQAVDGVKAVENLLHPPGTPPPSKGDGHAAGLAEERGS